MPKECIYKNNASFDGGRYFFMEITKSKRIIIKVIMYSFSIATTSFQGDDGITAQLLHCFQSYLLTDFSIESIIQHILYYFNILLQKSTMYYTKRGCIKQPLLIYILLSSVTALTLNTALNIKHTRITCNFKVCHHIFKRHILLLIVRPVYFSRFS